jgi:hypothetical protein
MFGRRRRSVAATVAALACALIGAAPAGASFGFAEDVAGTAFPGDVAFWAGTCELDDPVVDGAGFGSPPDAGVQPRPHCIDHGYPSQLVAAEPTWQTPPSWRLDPVGQAGAHPDASAALWLRRSPIPGLGNPVVADGDIRDVTVRLPPGVVGDPTAVPFCTSEQLRIIPTSCPPETQIGIVTATVSSQSGPKVMTLPIYNAEARDGKTAEFMVSGAGVATPLTNIATVAKVRTDGDFGIDAMVIRIPTSFPLMGQTVTLWGVPWATEHDAFRPEAGYMGSGTGAAGAGPGMPLTGLAGGTAPIGDRFEQSQEPQRYRPAWGEIRPFLSNPTACGANPGDRLSTVAEMNSWQTPEQWVGSAAVADVAIDGCEQVPFDAGLSLQATTSAADSPSGLDAELTLPVNDRLPFDRPPLGAPQPVIDAYVEAAADYWANDPGRLSTAQLKDTVVRLPEGLSLNPSGAAGLVGCTDSQIGLVESGAPPRFNNGDPFDGSAADGAECPAGSRIGEIEVHTPVLDDTLAGDLVLGTPKSTDPTSGEMLRTFLVVRSKQRGLVAKIYGSATADPQTGRLIATFANNPQLPLERVKLRLKGGERGLLRTAQTCGDKPWDSVLTPWTAVHGATSPLPLGGTVPVDAGCGFGFQPGLDAGSENRAAGASGRFAFTVTRQDGEQWITRLSAKLPEGLVASLRGVPLCTSSQADAGACPAGSRVGTVDAAAGAGDPFVLERKGDAYLTEGYKGAPYGMAIVVPVEAGPFRGALGLGNIVVRQALHIDRRTAGVTVISDPLPQIWHGIPLAMRRATVLVDRAGFMRNPTDCTATQIAATIVSAQGTTVERGDAFQATGCAALPFKPKLAIALTGKKQTKTSGHPGVKATATQTNGQAGIKRVEVRLPKSLALDPENAQALCEYVDGTKPELENHCPNGSIVGRARASSPLLNRPLAGNVYFVKNVRTDKRTGNQIRTLPMIVVALRGEIAINLHGESSSTRAGKLVSTFATIPDAPVDRFNLNINGGRNGILTVTRTRRSKIDICARRQVAQADIDGHNGRRGDQDVRIKTPCAKRKSRKARAKARAKRRAAAERARDGRSR